MLLLLIVAVVLLELVVLVNISSRVILGFALVNIFRRMILNHVCGEASNS